MYIDFGERGKQENKGSCSILVNYLEKENEGKEELKKRQFFSHTSDRVLAEDVVHKIDTNHKKFKRTEAKFYMLVISPSEKELMHIKCKDEALRDYTRAYMDSYAKNFNKGLKGDDLVYFAKIEEFRKDENTKIQKEGLNFHVHVIVSRMDREKRYSLSPWTNHINTKTGPITGGFYRNDSRQASQDIFDKMFSYNRSREEEFSFQNNARKERELQKKEAKKEKPIEIKSIPILNLQLLANLMFPATESIHDFDDEEQIRKKKRKQEQQRPGR